METSLAHGLKRISIIGAGDVGATLGRLLAACGLCSVSQILNRSIESATAAASFIGTGTPVSDITALDLTGVDLVMITVPDHAIAAVAEGIAQLPLAHGDRQLIAFHCSGATPASALAVLCAENVFVASVHPIKTFSDPERAVVGFAGTYCGMEGDAVATAELKHLFAAIGAKVFDVRSDAKPIYHAATVFACNYLFTLIDAAFRCFEAAGVERPTAAAAIEPILHDTVRNALRLGPARALSGPIARGDYRVVGEQIAALAGSDAQLARLYCQLALGTLDLASAKGSADAASLARIKEIVLDGLRD